MFDFWVSVIYCTVSYTLWWETFNRLRLTSSLLHEKYKHRRLVWKKWSKSQSYLFCMLAAIITDDRSQYGENTNINYLSLFWTFFSVQRRLYTLLLFSNRASFCTKRTLLMYFGYTWLRTSEIINVLKQRNYLRKRTKKFLYS